MRQQQRPLRHRGTMLLLAQKVSRKLPLVQTHLQKVQPRLPPTKATRGKEEEAGRNTRWNPTEEAKDGGTQEGRIVRKTPNEVRNGSRRR